MNNYNDINNIMEQIRLDAYNSGYTDGLNEGRADADKRAKCAYSNGEMMAWSLANRIVSNKEEMEDDIFHGRPLAKIFEEYPVEKARNKIREYNEKKQKEVSVGCEVYQKKTDTYAIVLSIDLASGVYASHPVWNVVYSNGYVHRIDADEQELWEKTGNNYSSSVANFLKQIR